MKKTLIMFLAISMITVFAMGCAPTVNNKDVDLKEVHDAVKESLGEAYVPDRDLEKQELENIVGTSTEDMAEYIAQSPMISMNIDTFIGIKAKDGKADEIEKGLLDYRDFLIENSMQYPMNIAKVNAAEVVRHGDYVFFLMLGNFDDREDVTEEEQLEFAQDEVRKVKEVIAEFFK
jgi:hypothetical protein